MNADLSKKRGGEEVLEALSSAKNDVTIIVNGQRFQCLKEELSRHSMYFQRMFNSNFKEKDEKEVELEGIVEPETFYMFLKVVSEEGVVTDVTVEELLHLADYLESAALEENCMRHLANETEFSLKQQFLLAETHHSEKLMRQVCGSIKDAYELDEVVPKDLDSFCNTTKNIIMQRSFELLGIRQPPSPPLPEDRNQLFELRMNQIIDQVEIQNHNGEVLKDQIYLLFEDTIIDMNLHLNESARQVIRDNHLIKELTDELRKVHEPDEVNFIQAQILVLKYKDIYTVLQNPHHGMDPASRGASTNIRKNLRDLALLINQNKRSHRSFRITLGDRKIDRKYRSYTRKAIRLCQRQRIRDLPDNASWIKKLNVLNDFLPKMVNKPDRVQQPMPDGIRHVSNRANFRTINEIVSNMRRFHYSSVRVIQPDNDEDGDEEVLDQGLDPEEQEQEDFFF